MKHLIIAVVLALAATAASAQQQTPLITPVPTTGTTPSAPSGIDVPGCTYYRMAPGSGEVRPICNVKSIPNLLHVNRYEVIDSPGADKGK